MKCPKCGYNSFEYLDSCKKCSADLSGFKQSLGIRPLLFAAGMAAATPLVVESPQEVIEELLPTLADEPGTQEGGAEEMFSFDFSAEPAAAKPSAEPAVPFDLPLDEPAAAAQDEEPFSFDELLPAEPEPSVEAEAIAPLEDFSFESAPAPAAEPPAAAATVEPFAEFSFEDAAAQEEEAAVSAAAEPFGEFSFEDNSFLPAEETTFDLEASLAEPSADQGLEGLLEATGNDFALPEGEPTLSEPEELPLFEAELAEEDEIETLADDAIIEEAEPLPDVPELFGEFDFEEPPQGERPAPKKSAAAVVQEFTEEEFKALFAAEEPKEENPQ